MDGNNEFQTEYYDFLSENDFVKGEAACPDKDAREKTFGEEFLKIMYIFKAKAILSDYFDLNRRYFKITDIVLFEDDKVKLDVLPKCYVDMIFD